MRRITFVVFALLLTSTSRADSTSASIESISPNAGDYRGGLRVSIKGKALIAHGCGEPPCHQMAVFFGNTPAQILFASDNEIIVRNPAHRAGNVNVMVTRIDGGASAIDFGFTYITGGVTLLPIVARDAAGANGSRWDTQTTFINRSANFLRLDPSGIRLDPKSIVRNPYPPDSPAVGRLIHIYKHWRDFLTMQLRLRDLSRQSETAGIEIPVVWNEDFFVDSLTLASVPTDRRFRVALRIYQVNEFERDGRAAQDYRVRVVGGGDDAQTIAEDIVRVETPLANANPDLPEFPAVYQNHDLVAAFPQIAAIPEVRLLVEPVNVAADHHPLFWAFVSVTHNETQHVTLVTPE